MKLRGLKQFSGVWCFPISWIALHEFSPQQVIQALHGIKPQVNQAMINGSKAHSQLFNAFKQEALVSDSIENILLKSVQETAIFSSRELFVFSPRLRVFGKIDEIEISPNSIKIIDDKASFKAFNGYQLQVLAYAFCFEQQFFPKHKIECVLRNTQSKQVFWQQELDEFQKQKVLEKIKQILELIEEESQKLAFFNGVSLME